MSYPANTISLARIEGITMEKEKFLENLKKLREASKKRKFNQSTDLIINLKDIDLKKPEEQVDFFLTFHQKTGKKRKVCALVGPELSEDAKSVCDKVITVDEFNNYTKDKKLVKNLATEYDFFIAQADIMPKVAAAFGKALGPRGKMPNPKAGCVVPPKGSLKPLYEKLQDTVKVTAKSTPVVQIFIGKENLKDDDLADNALEAYSQLESKLPKGHNNIKNVFIKFTMSKPEKIV